MSDELVGYAYSIGSLRSFAVRPNLIEVRWLWMHRQAINNTTFQNERDIGKAVSDWARDYNKKHPGKTSINSLHEESIYMFT